MGIKKRGVDMSIFYSVRRIFNIPLQSASTLLRKFQILYSYRKTMHSAVHHYSKFRKQGTIVLNIYKKLSRGISLAGLFLFLPLAGCQTSPVNYGQVQSYPFSLPEPEWIRNGDPIEFEEGLWYPADDIESLLDSEVYLAGEYKGIQIFVDKEDVRPFARLYTKFGKNKFRFFERKDAP